MIAQRETFARWTKRLTAVEEARVLQVLADAQEAYNTSAELRRELRSEVDRLREERLTDDQLARVAPLQDALFAAWRNKVPDAEALAIEQKLMDMRDVIRTEQDATMPTKERELHEAAEHIERDLEDQVKAAFAEFLTPDQIEMFDVELVSVSHFLRRNYNKFTNEEYARELAARTQ